MEVNDNVKAIVSLREERELIELNELRLNQITKGTACIINCYNSKVFNSEELALLKEEIFSLITTEEQMDLSESNYNESIQRTVFFYINNKYLEIGGNSFNALLDMLDFDKESSNFYIYFQNKVNEILSSQNIDVTSKFGIYIPEIKNYLIVYDESEIPAMTQAWDEIKSII